jgi:hypothetical protein
VPPPPELDAYLLAESDGTVEALSPASVLEDDPLEVRTQ